MGIENEEIQIKELNNETIESMIYIIRGQKVMLDFELAKIYGYETKNFNRQVKNNIDKFPDDFRFILTKEEIEIVVRCKNFTSRSWEHSNEGGRRYLPYAFTEQGIYMLMTVLKGELATKQSIALVRAFKQMKDYIIENNNLMLNTNSYIESRFSTYDKRFEVIENKLEVVMDNFIDPSKYKHYLIKDGERIEADIAYQEIYIKAKYSIYIIDDYIDVKTLQLLKCINSTITIIVITDNKGKNNLNPNFINDFIKDTGFNIIFKYNNSKFHDRYIVIDFNTNDYSLYHCGTSSKDSGNRINTIMRIDDKNPYISSINKVLNNKNINI